MANREKDIKGYTEAESLEGINFFGYDTETGEGRNIPGNFIERRLQLASVSSASWTGAATATIDLDKLTDFGEIPAVVTGLTISITAATAPMVSQCAFQFSLAASTTFDSLSINLGSTPCKIANAPDTWETGKTYQVTMVNGYAVVGAFE